MSLCISHLFQLAKRLQFHTRCFKCQSCFLLLPSFLAPPLFPLSPLFSLLLPPHHSTSPSNPLLLFTPLSPSKILTSTYLCVQGVCGGGEGWGLRSQILRVLFLQLESQELNSVHHGVEVRTFAYQAILPACFLLLKDNL